MGDVEGTVITMDALHANSRCMEKITEKGAYYLIQVKGNCSALEKALDNAFGKKGATIHKAQSLGKEHGRIEKRTVSMTAISPVDTKWPHTWTACRVERYTELIRRGQVVSARGEQALYVASFPVNAFSPDQVLTLIRRHWGIENELHHTKDRSLDEDRCRASERGAGRTLALFRSIIVQISRRTSESLGVICQRFAGKPHWVLSILRAPSLVEWENKAKPYKLA